MMKTILLILALIFPFAASAQWTLPQHIVHAIAAPVVPSIVQSKSTGTSGSGGTVAFTSPVTVGNVLLAAIYGGSAGSTLTFTDSLGNTATVLASAGLAGDDDAVAIICAPITTGGTDTLTFKVNGSSGLVIATAYEATNATCTQDVTAVHTNTNSVTSCNSGPLTTSTANDLLIGACGSPGTAAGIPAGSGWTGITGGNTGASLLLSEYQIGTTPGTFTATSGTFVSEEQASILVALKP